MPRRRLTFRSEEARQVLWVRCLEEADATGVLVPAELRTAVSREARSPENGPFLLHRAELLGSRLAPGLEAPEVPPATWMDKLPAWAPWAAVGGAFVLGWATNEFGPSGHINILSFPLLGLILWNLTVCGVSLFADWKAKRKPAPRVSPPRRAPGMDTLAIARAEFVARAQAWETPRRNARLKGVFHAAAIALALGIVGGMYFRGLGKSYTATWESTFLKGPEVRTLTKAVLGPASLVTGIAVPEPPDPKDLEPQSAAPWIHLWAASALLFIAIPRLILANMARVEARKTQPDYEAEFGSWLAVCRGLGGSVTHQAEILPVHYEPESRVRDGLRLVLKHLWGAHVSADFDSPVAYGAEDLVSLPRVPDYLVLVCALSTTPESEVHGALIQSMADAGPERRRRLLVLDASAFEARFRSLQEYPSRLAARLAAWEKVASGNFPMLLLDDAARRDPAAAARSVSPP